MATSNDIIDDSKYLLVSDSNEVGSQYDSKKLRQSELAYLAQENLFKRHLGIMQFYLTKSQYEVYEKVLGEKYDAQSSLFSMLESNPSVRFKPVDGQVILLDAAEVDKQSNSPMEYLKEHWNITAEFTVDQIHDCMLRGVTARDVQNGDKTKLEGNLKVGLTDANMPTHMHNSAVTTDGNINSLHVSTSNSRCVQGEIEYDMFYNDSFSTGVDFNELQGTVNDFQVQDSGGGEQVGDELQLMHNNLPNYRKFYAFVIHKNG